MRHFILSLAVFTFCAPVAVAQSEQLDAIIERYDAHQSAFSPDVAARQTRVPATTWSDVSPETLSRKAAAEQALLTDLKAMDRETLSENELISAQILERILADRVERAPFDEARIPFTGDWGFYSLPGFTLARARIRTVEQAEAAIARIEAVPAYLEANRLNMRRGIETGFMAHKDPVATMIEQLGEIIVDDPTESQFYTPFKSLTNSIPETEQARLQEEAKAAICVTIAAYEDFLRFVTLDYAPNVRDGAGIADLPQGKELYAFLIRQFTTDQNMTPEQVHEIGVEEVARIRAEMEAILEEIEFEGTFAEFLTFLRTDEGFYAQSPEELLAAAARFSKDLDLKMPQFFKTLPRLPYGVEPVPMAIAPGYTTGRYISGDADEGRAGIYWVNTYALDQRPLYELPALTAHEAVPGHHHQIALAQELRGVPEFRKNYYATAFGEGWGLYSETLAGEMGLYTTPYERFGKLSYEMWRACRLVADTGLHWYGWTREQAEECFTENSALAPLNIKTEVTRYIGWPGQATAYKIGELTILRLRSEAKEALGDDFDIREFHDVVLGKGAMPLSMLEARVDAWVEAQLAE